LQSLEPPGPERQDDVGPDFAEPPCAAFRETADPSAYVPRPASEDALAALQSITRGAQTVAVLSGPPGLGKTLLLRVLEDRHRTSARPVYLPYASLQLDELAAWGLGLLHHEPASDPVAALCEAARAGFIRRGPLLLLIDDANSMPVDTARALGEHVEACQGELRLVLAAPDDARTSRVVAALGQEAVERRFDRPMTEAETEHYVSERLRAEDAEPIVWRRLNRGIVRRLHGLSGGNPRRLHALASEVVRGEPGQPVLRQIEPAWPDLLGDDVAPAAADAPEHDLEEEALFEAPTS